MLEQSLLLVRDPGFKPCRLGGDVCGFAHDAVWLSSSLPYCTAYGRTRQESPACQSLSEPVSRDLHRGPGRREWCLFPSEPSKRMNREAPCGHHGSRCTRCVDDGRCGRYG